MMSPRLSGKTRLFLAGNTLSMLGTGLVLPFMIIYLHQARGIALPSSARCWRWGRRPAWLL